MYMYLHLFHEVFVEERFEDVLSHAKDIAIILVMVSQYYQIHGMHYIVLCLRELCQVLVEVVPHSRHGYLAKGNLRVTCMKDIHIHNNTCHST